MGPNEVRRSRTNPQGDSKEVGKTEETSPNKEKRGRTERGSRANSLKVEPRSPKSLVRVQVPFCLDGRPRESSPRGEGKFGEEPRERETKREESGWNGPRTGASGGRVWGRTGRGSPSENPEDHPKAGEEPRTGRFGKEGKKEEWETQKKLEPEGEKCTECIHGPHDGDSQRIIKILEPCI